MFYFSKSKYCGFWQCPKNAWLTKYKPDEKIVPPETEAVFKTGNEVGDLAMGLFGDFVEVTAYKDDKLDLSRMITDTVAEMEKGTSVICEASFSYEGLYCAVDILRKDSDGWAVYEVKSSTEIKDIYHADVAYQKYVLERCGVNVTGTYIVYINKEYVLEDELDIAKLFKVENVSEITAVEIEKVGPNLALAEELLENKEEPATDLSMNCSKPYLCGFWEYCSRHIPKPSVFDLYRMNFSKKLEYYHKGVITYEDMLADGTEKNEIRRRQIDYYLNDRGTYIDREKIREFLKKLSYPLYFLDFETIQPAVPKYKGSKPYSQIPFQYSLHYIESEDGELKHSEFLAEPGCDPRRELAEHLCRDIPEDVCVTAYNKSFECGRIGELADLYPDLREHLLSIKANIVDLLEPFQKGYYYNKSMGGSFSIKSVLPAIFPDDPELDYHNLDEVHNGTEAMNIYPQMEFMDPDALASARHNLLKYCELDTYAMVKVWQELVRVSE